MSGEMSGAIIGGAVLIAALPYVVAGAAAIGATYGAVRLTGAVVRHAAQRREYKSFETHYSSRQLSQMYGKMNDAVDRQRKEEERLQRERARLIEKETRRLKDLTEKMEKLAGQVRASEEGAKREEAERELAALKGQISQQQAALAQAVNRDESAAVAYIRQQAQQEARQAIEEMERLQRAQNQMLDWQTTDERIRAQQLLYIRQSLQDAERSIVMLEAMRGMDEAAARVAETLHGQLEQARAQVDQGLLEAALASCEEMITRCALTSLQCAERHEEREWAAELLLQDLEALEEEMDHRRFLSFRLEENEETIEEDLNDFSQGVYTQVQEHVRQMLAQLEARQDMGMTAQQILLMRQQFQDTLRPSAVAVMEAAQRSMMSYYEKRAAMDVIADCMAEQGYEVDWGETIGGDLTEKMVLHFANETTGNTVAVSLDEDMTEEELLRMTMDLMMFYGEEDSVSEEDKQSLRDALRRALGERGLQGLLKCSGQVNRPSEQVQYNDAKAVRAQTPRRQFRRE